LTQNNPKNQRYFSPTRAFLAFRDPRRVSQLPCSRGPQATARFRGWGFSFTPKPF